MDIAASELMTRIAELGQNRANADVTLNCEGITIKAHSFILELRSDYFKTALNTNVGDRRNSVEVHECSHRVLSVIIDFMYGIALPEELGVHQLCSLLAMADLYLMEGLKNAVAPLLSKMLELDNILGISRLAEKHTATKLRERCFSFIFANADTMSPQLMDDLAIALPLLGRACLQRYRVQAFANRISHYDLHMDLYKKRAEFSSDLDYGNFVRVKIKSGMIVQYMGGKGGNSWPSRQ